MNYILAMAGMPVFADQLKISRFIMAGNIEVTKDANNKFVATEDLTLADGDLLGEAFWSPLVG